jgi:hypothetical protein
MRRRGRGSLFGLVLAVAALGMIAWSVNGSAFASNAEKLSRTPSFPSPIRHVFVIMLENEESFSVLKQGPYEKYLATKYAFANQFYSVMHYSLPNYLAATSGYTTNLFSPVSVPNVGTLATAAGETWKAYMQSMPYACDGTGNGTYDIYHSPFMMYKTVLKPVAYCRQHVVNFTVWSNSFGNKTMPNYDFVVANTTNDGHDTNISTADTWLKSWLSPVINSSLFRTSAIFVLYDEGAVNDTSGRNGSPGGGHVYFSAVSPYARPNFTSNVSYNTFDLLTTTEWLLGLGHTGHNDNWTLNPPMTDLFNFSSAKSFPVGSDRPGHLDGQLGSDDGATLDYLLSEPTMEKPMPSYAHAAQRLQRSETR